MACFIENEIIINFVGKAHDTKNISDSSSYVKANVQFTKDLYEAFIKSNAHTLIHLSSIKAVADSSNFRIDETTVPNPSGIYGETKLEGEKILLKNPIPTHKRIIVIRPTMIYGFGVKGNMHSLIKWVQLGLPWPFSKIENKRNLCSIHTLFKFIDEVIENESIPSGIYHVCDSDALSSNDIVRTIAKSLKKKIIFLPIPLLIFKFIAKLGNHLPFSPINEEKLNKLSANFLVDNSKMKQVFNKPLEENLEEDFNQLTQPYK